MKILHINTNDTGGAATACLRIHAALLKKGVDSKVLVLNKQKKNKKVYQFKYWDNTHSQLKTIKKGFKQFMYERLQRKREIIVPRSSVYFTFPQTIYDITTHPLYQEADIIQLNWVSGFLDEPSFFAKNTKPVIWRMSDLYVCGGGNHYDVGYDYTRYKEFHDANLEIREKALKDVDINLVPISKWTEERAKRNHITKNYKTVLIHNGVDQSVFREYDKIFARKVFDLPLDKIIFLAGADSLYDERKGYQILVDAIQHFSDNKDVAFYSFGKDSLENDKIKALGEISDERLLAILYSATDYFLMTSVEETFGQVTIEALACGTPVISLPNGGSLDIIKQKENGILAEDFTPASLVKAINEALLTKFNHENIKEDIAIRFNINNIADQYIALYNSILDTDQ